MAVLKCLSIFKPSIRQAMRSALCGHSAMCFRFGSEAVTRVQSLLSTHRKNTHEALICLAVCAKSICSWHKLNDLAAVHGTVCVYFVSICFLCISGDISALLMPQHELPSLPIFSMSQQPHLPFSLPFLVGVHMPA